MSFSINRTRRVTFNKFFVIVLIVLLKLQLAQATLKGRCGQLNDKALTRVCTQLYPYALILKYRDGYVDEKMPYAVFSIDGGDNQYLIAHGNSPLFNCSANVKFNSARNITCDQNTLRLKKSFMVCLLFRASVADELINYCAGTSETATRFVAMHYHEPRLHSISAGSSMNLKLYFFHILWLLKSLLICAINK